MTARVVAIVQARMGSTRLPGKTLMDLAGKTVLDHVLDRLGRCERLDEVVVATTTNPEDDAVAVHCTDRGAHVFRGDADDVLDRYHAAAHAHRADVVARITADCPLLDPAVVDRVVQAALRPDIDYASNVHPQTYPDGLDCEAFPVAALDAAWSEARLPSEREHVTPFLWQQPERFRSSNVAGDADLSHHRWTLDDADDLTFLRALAAHLPSDDPSMAATLQALRDAGLTRTDADAPRNEGYRRSLEADAQAGPQAGSEADPKEPA